MAKKELWRGNDAMAEAALRGGCGFFAGYPITPQSEMTEYLSWRMLELGRDFVQAESEVGAINMVMGATAAGARAMTATAGMAVSLMMEGLSWLVVSELPSVVINLHRNGAGGGGLDPSQTDYNYLTKTMGHGGMRAYVLAPSTVQEAVDMAYEAFDFAEREHCMVFILTDAMVGQLMEAVTLPEFKSEDAFAPRELVADGCKGREKRYLLGLSANDDVNRHKRLAAKYERWEREEVRCEEYCIEDAETVLVAWGTGARIARGAVDTLRAEGKKVGLLRPVTIYPFPFEHIRALDPARVKNVLVAEIAVPKQMYYDVDYACRGLIPVHSLARLAKEVFTTEEVEQELRKLL